MTTQQAERITGHAVIVWRGNNGHYTCDLYLENQGEPPLLSGTGRNSREAVRRAVEANYRRNSVIVFSRAKWRCEDCGRIRPLQAHHKVLRSHGRRDTVDNLLALCQECHMQRHGGR